MQAALEKVCHPVIQQKVQTGPRRECWEVQMFPPVKYLTHCSKTSLYKTEILKERTGRQGTKCRNKRKTSNRRKRNKRNARTSTATTILTKQVPRNNKHIKWQKATNTAKRERREANKRSCCKSDTSAVRSHTDYAA